MKTRFFAAALSLTLAGCSPAVPVWEYQTRAVSTSEKDATLSASGKQGWELVSAQESRAGTDAEIKALQVQKREAQEEINQLFAQVYQAAAQKPKMLDILKPFEIAFERAGDDIAETKEASVLTSQIAEQIGKGRSYLSPLERGLISQTLQRITFLGQKKARALEKLQSARANNCKLVFKRQKKP